MNRSRFFIGLLIIALLILTITYKLVYKKHRDVAKEKASFELTSDAFINEFNDNEKIASARYLNKVILVGGTVSEIDEYGITIDQAVYAKFDKEIELTITKDSKVKIKGRCIGYDELLETVKLDQCTLIN